MLILVNRKLALNATYRAIALKDSATVVLFILINAIGYSLKETQNE